MTVAELVARLADLPEDASVRVMQEGEVVDQEGHYIEVQLESDLRDLAVTRKGVVLIGNEIE